MAEKPLFRKAFATRRCLVSADGHYICPVAAPLLAMAGIAEWWRAPDGSRLGSVAIITCGSTDALGRIHDRMPMVVDDVDSWFDRSLTGADVALKLLRNPGDRLTSHRVSPRVGCVANDDATLVQSVE